MAENKIHISIISPVYKGELFIDELVSRIVASASEISKDFEIILVEDCGPDRSWYKIKNICSRDHRVKALRLSRNFGQHYAITAGLDHVSGEWVIVMDCDLQDRPEEIPALYSKAKEGYDIVLARRFNRQDSYLKKLSSKYFHKLLSYLSGVRYDSSIANFGIYHKNVIDAIKQMREPIRFFPSMIKWVGFRSSELNVVHGRREHDTSSYTFRKKVDLAFNIILAHSDKPLRLTVKLGLVISLIALLYGIYVLYKYFTGSISVSGWTSVVISVWFLSGTIISILGIIGLYIGKIFEGVKNRPIYIVREKLNG